MNPHTNYLAVGIFLLLGIVGLVVLVMWLGRAGDNIPKAQYVVQIQGDVNGLSNGSAVRYLGVNVGSVVDIRLNTETGAEVDVYIDINEELPINETTYATLVVQGVTGIANVDLGHDGEVARPMKNHPSGQTIIPFRATGLSAMLAGSGDLTTDAQRLLAQLNQLTGEENLLRVRTILANVEDITQAVADQRAEIPELLATLKSTVTSLERTAQRMESAMKDDWPQIAADLKTTSQNLSSVSGRVDGWLEANDENVDRLLDEGLDSAAKLITDLRGAADELSRLSSKLREDPSRIVYRSKHDPVVAEP